MHAVGNDLNLGNIVRSKNGTRNSLRMSAESRSMHLHIVGATGTGKSKFLEHLIWQDLKNWKKSRSGLLLLDPHGSVYKSVMRRLSEFQVDNPTLPIVPIDLTQESWIVSYNPLRKRNEAHRSSIVINSFVDAMAHVFKQGDTASTPRFSRYARNILRAVYENGHTLSDVALYTDRIEQFIRKKLTEGISDNQIRNEWRFINLLPPDKFDGLLESTISRLRPFIESETLQCIFGNPNVSLDLDRALEEGWIILVNLSQENTVIQSDDPGVVGTLLLHDLWMAAKHRGKRKGIKPFYVYLDEFQEFVTPEIAKSLDQARGFGLHFTLAHQYPSQVKHASKEHGDWLYDSLMINARNKIVFQFEHEQDLRSLAFSLFRGAINPDKIKHEVWSTKVMDYKLEYQKGYSMSESRTVGGSESQSRSWGESWSSGTSRGGSESEAQVRQANELFADYITATDTTGSSESESSSRGSSNSESSGETTSWSKSSTESVSYNPMLRPILGKELSSVQFESVEEQLFRAMAVLSDQEQRQFVAKLENMREPARVFTPFVRDGVADHITVNEYVDRLCGEMWDFTLPRSEACALIHDRTSKLVAEFLQKKTVSEEPKSYKRVLRKPKDTDV